MKRQQNNLDKYTNNLYIRDRKKKNCGQCKELMSETYIICPACGYVFLKNYKIP